MAINHNDKNICPLLKREILYGECYEVQEYSILMRTMRLICTRLTQAKKLCSTDLKR